MKQKNINLMEEKINNWVYNESGVYYGLNYSTCKGSVGNYVFDIRYDYDGPKDIKPVGGLALSITYKGKHIASEFANSVQYLKAFSEKWLLNEVSHYYKSYCTLYTEEQLTKPNYAL